jgi:hypothetical protein
VIPPLATVPIRTPRSQRRARFGTFTLSTMGRSTAPTAPSHSTIDADTAAAVRQAASRPWARLRATAGKPRPAAVSAAPTVPECRMAAPVLAPALMPDTTSVGGIPKPPWHAASTASAGGPSMA